MTFPRLAEAIDNDGPAPKHPLSGKVWNAFGGFLAPFKQSGNWVDDARGKSVCDAQSPAVAKEIAKTLNEKYPKKA